MRSEEAKAPAAPLLMNANGVVAHHASYVVSFAAFGDGIGQWALGIVCTAGAFIHRFKQCVAQQRIPKFLISHFSFLVNNRFLTPHSSLLTHAALIRRVA